MIEFIKFLEYLGISRGDQLFAYAKTQLGFKKSGVKASIEYGCAESVNRIFKECFGSEIGGDVSTIRLYEALKKSKRFVSVTVPKRGDIIISPTGQGSGAIPNGHVGIVSENGKIMSNESATGQWKENYDMEKWYNRYHRDGGYPVYYFRMIL